MNYYRVHIFDYQFENGNLIIKIQCGNLDQFNEFLQEFREKYGRYLTQTVTMVCTETLV